MFLRHVVRNSARPVVYLSATRCVNGVLDAIQAKLQGQATDEVFLRSLIYSGAMDVCIDGINEVAPDTRAKIGSFAESHFKANIIVGTQPLPGWKAPSTAKLYELQPLTEEQIKAFLMTRWQAMSIDARLNQNEYEQACCAYLQQTLHGDRSQEHREATQRMLSNPMDLTVVATMLADGREPDLFALRQQQYHIMAEDYKRDNLNRGFPLREFSEHAYELRLTNQANVSEEHFHKELLCMERHKLVMRRQLDPKKPETTEWNFRHDKIWDFFVVQTFLGRDNERPGQHMDDPRFRGVYLLLAMLLPIEDAQTLERLLIDYAADSKDHAVSDTFVQLLRMRPRRPPIKFAVESSDKIDHGNRL